MIRDKTSPNTIVEFLSHSSPWLFYCRMRRRDGRYHQARIYNLDVEPTYTLIRSGVYPDPKFDEAFEEDHLESRRLLREYFDSIGVEHDDK